MENKVQKVMREFKLGKLTSHGKKVTNRKQAVAIALSEAGLTKKMASGGYVSLKTYKIKNTTAISEDLDRYLLKNKDVKSYSNNVDTFSVILSPDQLKEVFDLVKKLDKDKNVYILDSVNNVVYDSKQMKQGGSVGGFQYKTISLMTPSDIRRAERLQNQGWYVISSSMDKIIMEKPKTKKMKKYKKGGSTSVSPAIYVADLTAYNNGQLVGEWLDLSGFDSGEEVMEKIAEISKKWGEGDDELHEEYAIHDYEGFPEAYYSEYMNEDSFDKVIAYVKASENFDADMIAAYINYYGQDADLSEMEDNFIGTFKDEGDFAYEQIEQMGGIGNFNNIEKYIYVTDIDRRIVAGEQADFYVDDMSDEDVLDQLNKQDDYDDLQNQIDDLEGEEDPDEKKIKDLTKAQEKLVEDAREELKERIYNEWSDGLNDDPVGFLVDQQGLYSKDDLQKASFISIDYDKLGSDLAYDYNVFDLGLDKYYVFSQH